MTLLCLKCSNSHQRVKRTWDIDTYMVFQYAWSKKVRREHSVALRDEAGEVIKPVSAGPCKSGMNFVLFTDGTEKPLKNFNQSLTAELSFLKDHSDWRWRMDWHEMEVGGSKGKKANIKAVHEMMVASPMLVAWEWSSGKIWQLFPDLEQRGLAD